MIHFRTNISQEDAQHIIENVIPKFSYRVDHTTLSWYMEAHNKMFEEHVGIPGCGCEYKATHAIWTSRISQYEPQLREIAYPPIKTRGRKKNV